MGTRDNFGIGKSAPLREKASAYNQQKVPIMGVGASLTDA
jgi:hypothetical protein